MKPFKFFRNNNELRHVFLNLIINDNYLLFGLFTCLSTNELESEINEIVQPFLFEFVTEHNISLIRRKLQKRFGDVKFVS